MSDTQSWYARKMSQMRGQPYQQQPQQQQYVQQPPPQQYVQRPQQQFVQQAPVQPQVTVANIYEAAGHWKGGAAARFNPDPCPQCGGNQYFPNLVANRRGPSPAGHCYNCGFNDGMFQQGMASSWGATA